MCRIMRGDHRTIGCRADAEDQGEKQRFGILQRAIFLKEEEVQPNERTHSRQIDIGTNAATAAVVIVGHDTQPVPPRQKKIE